MYVWDYLGGSLGSLWGYPGGSWGCALGSIGGDFWITVGLLWRYFDVSLENWFLTQLIFWTTDLDNEFLTTNFLQQLIFLTNCFLDNWFFDSLSNYLTNQLLVWLSRPLVLLFLSNSDLAKLYPSLGLVGCILNWKITRTRIIRITRTTIRCSMIIQLIHQIKHTSNELTNIKSKKNQPMDETA